MKKLYDFFVGRKLFYFNVILLMNLALMIYNKWVAEFGYFCIALYMSIVIGIEGNKYIKGKNDKE